MLLVHMFSLDRQLFRDSVWNQKPLTPVVKPQFKLT